MVKNAELTNAKDRVLMNADGRKAPAVCYCWLGNLNIFNFDDFNFNRARRRLNGYCIIKLFTNKAASNR